MGVVEDEGRGFVCWICYLGDVIVFDVEVDISFFNGIVVCKV